MFLYMSHFLLVHRSTSFQEGLWGDDFVRLQVLALDQLHDHSHSNELDPRPGCHFPATVNCQDNKDILLSKVGVCDNSDNLQPIFLSKSVKWVRVIEAFLYLTKIY